MKPVLYFFLFVMIFLSSGAHGRELDGPCKVGVINFNNKIRDHRLDWIGKQTAGSIREHLRKVESISVFVFSAEWVNGALKKRGCFHSEVFSGYPQALEIGKELNATHIVFGSYKFDVNRLRISCQLNSVSPNRKLYAKTIIRGGLKTRKDIMRVIHEMAKDIYGVFESGKFPKPAEGSNIPGSSPLYDKTKALPEKYNLQELLNGIKEGDEITVPPGVYLSDRTYRVLRLKNAVIHFPAGTKILVTDGRYGVFSLEGCKNVSITGGYFGHELPEAYGGCDEIVMWIYKSSGIALMDCEIVGCGVIGLSVLESEKIRVESCNFHDNNCEAVALKKSSDITLQNNYIHHNGQSIIADDVKRLRLSENSIECNKGIYTRAKKGRAEFETPESLGKWLFSALVYKNIDKFTVASVNSDDFRTIREKIPERDRSRFYTLYSSMAEKFRREYGKIQRRAFELGIEWENAHVKAVKAGVNLKDGVEMFSSMDIEFVCTDNPRKVFKLMWGRGARIGKSWRFTGLMLTNITVEEKIFRNAD